MHMASTDHEAVFTCVHTMRVLEISNTDSGQVTKLISSGRGWGGQSLWLNACVYITYLSLEQVIPHPSN